jgi:DnaK suppressor protein
MKKEILDALTELLRNKRRSYLQEFRRAQEGLDAIAEERETELEEHAQEEQTARVLTRLDHQTLTAVKDIDAALNRILRGAYGKCEKCHRKIAIARLRVLPAARFCARCASQDEGEKPVVVASELRETFKAPEPADLSLLNDRELLEYVREQLRQDGRIDMEELRLVCRKGVVHLAGTIPSEAEHQVLLQILTDVLGIKEFVDHLNVDKLLWEQDKRTKAKAQADLPPWQELPGTEDIVESTEEDKEFIPPSNPTPEEE